MPEPPAEHSERTGLVAEEVRRLGGGDALGKEGAQRLVLPLSGVGRFPKEALLVCTRIWCFYNDVQNLAYRGGEGPIVHLEADLRTAVGWANQAGRRWAFTLSNAGGRYFEDRRSLDELDEIDWAAVSATAWSGRGIPASVKDGKQAEFLVERHFPWELVERIGVRSREIAQRVSEAMAGQPHRPAVEIRKDWYYGG
jgi:hypothetical protein